LLLAQQGMLPLLPALSPAELTALRLPRDQSGSFVLVAKNQSAPLKIVRSHFDRHSIFCQRFNAVFPHSAASVGNKLVFNVEPNSVAGVGQYFQNETLKPQKFFFRHKRPFCCGENLPLTSTVRHA
jgi:hypothetical protein